MIQITDISTDIVHNDREEKYEFLNNLPDNHTLHKCHFCNFIFDISQDGQLNILTILKTNSYVYCPNCMKRDPELMCKVLAYSIWQKIKGKNCMKGELIPGADSCPICFRPMCPECHNHSVISLSRVTGYVSDRSGWNNGKRQEFLDRQRYTI